MEYVIILVLVTVVLIGGAWLVRKFKLTEKDKNFAYLMIEALKYINKNMDTKFKDEVEVITVYVTLAIDKVGEFNSSISLDEKKDIIYLTALDICKKNGIEVDEELVVLIKTLVNFFVE